MKQSLLEYVYVVSERQRGGAESSRIYKGFSLDGDAAQAWQNQLLDNPCVDRFKERVEELDEYTSDRPSTREFPKSIYLIECLEHDIWLVKGYILCEERAKALLVLYPDTYRYQVLDRIQS